MNETMSLLLLLSVPGLPLLLAFPALRSFLSRPGYAALLPAIVIIASAPQFVVIDMPWLLFGTTLGIDETSRLLLAMSLVLWIASASFLHGSGNYTSDGRFTTYFMLTMAANMGAIIAADLMTFYVFATLMSYAFYALLVSGGDEDAQQSAAVYLSLMIVADLILLEALFTAAAMADDPGFAAVHSMTAQSPSLNLYLLLVLTGFAIKAGLWPLHFWLTRVFCASRPAVSLLLGGVPIAIGLLGMLRWLPLGEITSPESGLLMQSFGIAAVLYAVISGLIQRQLRLLPVNAIIFATGFYTGILGTGLADPALWKQYGHWVSYFIACFAVGYALLTIIISRLGTQCDHSAAMIKPLDNLSHRLQHHYALMRSYWNKNRIFSAAARQNYRAYSPIWKKILDNGEHILQRWNIAITVFLLLGIMVIFVSVLF